MRRDSKYGLVLLVSLLLSTSSSHAQDTEGASVTLRGLLVALEKALPGQFDYDSVEGKTSGPFRFRNLRYRDGDLLVAISELDFDWTPTALLKGTVDIRRLRAMDVVVHLPDTEPTESAQPDTVGLPELSLPLRFLLNDVAAQRVSLRLDTSAEPVVLDSVALKAELTGAGNRSASSSFNHPRRTCL